MSLDLRARAATLGFPIPAGARRHDQAGYPDPDPSFCSAPPGSTFNVTSAVRVLG